MKWRKAANTHDGSPCGTCGGTRRNRGGNCVACYNAAQLRRQAEVRDTLRDAYEPKPRPIPSWKPPKMAPGLTLDRLMAGK
jgi:hypothetical protein